MRRYLANNNGAAAVLVAAAVSLVVIIQYVVLYSYTSNRATTQGRIREAHKTIVALEELAKYLRAGSDTYTVNSPPTPLTIQITSASYGANVTGANSGNATSSVGSSCNGNASCSYYVDTAVLGDPAPFITKTFVVNYTCSGGPQQTASLPAEAYQQTLSLSCNTNICPAGTTMAAFGSQSYCLPKTPATATSPGCFGIVDGTGTEFCLTTSSFVQYKPGQPTEFVAVQSGQNKTFEKTHGYFDDKITSVESKVAQLFEKEMKFLKGKNWEQSLFMETALAQSEGGIIQSGEHENENEGNNRDQVIRKLTSSTPSPTENPVAHVTTDPQHSISTFRAAPNVKCTSSQCGQINLCPSWKHDTCSNSTDYVQMTFNINP